ncbi:hypothetical protein SLEP1_g30072 [Rubroshorea leprosula]|uniref:Uncharacterized protein n=1 Tax=Rubroshorea leprosula TaxID=152421 RepID=A0AAV5K1E1_9ROSI|nr:hypothetical protein SLEP1_g30072 [Rubroshorea leprosula]
MMLQVMGRMGVSHGDSGTLMMSAMGVNNGILRGSCDNPMGEALHWLQAYMKGRIEWPAWEEFCMAICVRFGVASNMKLVAKWRNVVQMGTLLEYQRDFVKIKAKVACSEEFAVEMFIGEEVDIAEVQDNQGERLEVQQLHLWQQDMPQLSLHALTGELAYQMLKVIRIVGKRSLMILIDFGTTHNFLDSKLAQELGCKLEDVKQFQVSMANDSQLSGSRRVADFTWKMKGLEFQLEMLLLPLGEYDVILGIQWLKPLGKVLWDFQSKTLGFTYKEKPMVLHAPPKPQIKWEACGVQLSRAETKDDPHLRQLLEIYFDVFEEPKELPPHKVQDHSIPLKGGIDPINVRPYRYPNRQKQVMEQLVQEMLQRGVIRRSTSPFSSPMVLVKKKDGTWRMCVDYKELNKTTINDKFPMLVIEELQDELHGVAFFSRIDLRAGYHQIWMKEEDVCKMAFRTHHGHFEFWVMTFELSNAPSTYQAVMNEMLEPYLRKFVLAFFDDILMYSRSWEKHLQHLNLILSVLRQHQFFAKHSKCSFGVQQIECLGHIIFAQGVATDPQKKIHSTLWHHCKPLMVLLQKDNFKWSTMAQAAFLRLKEAMVKAHVLALPNFKEEFVIETDALGFGIGAVLMQKGHPITLLSKALAPAHQGLSTYEKELMAVVMAIDKWRQYLIVRQVETILDCKENTVADALSRVPSTHITSMAISTIDTSLFFEIQQSWQVDEPLPIPDKVWEDISMDFIEGLPLSQGRTIIMVVVDQLSKITLRMSSAYHPQTNGQTEVVNHCLETYLRCMCGLRPKEWVQWLPLAEWCFTAKTLVFAGQNYTIWAVKMKAYLRAFELWEVVETDRQLAPLPPNATLAQIKRHLEEVAKRCKALTCLHLAVTDEIFNRIMTCETAKEAWDKLKVEFQGDNKARQMEVLNLKREFALIRMKDTETVKEFFDRLTKVVNKIRLQGEELFDKAVVEKVLVSLSEKFEHNISSLEDSKYLSQFSLNDLVNALQAVEQRKTLRLENNVEGAYLATDREKATAKDDENKQFGDKRNREKKGYQSGRYKNKKQSFAPCSHCKKKNHSENYCWFRPGIQCRSYKLFGHIEKVSNLKGGKTQQAQVAEITEQMEEKLFMASSVEACCLARLSPSTWLIDSCCTNHMTNDLAIFKSLDKNYSSRVRLGNGDVKEVKGKRVVGVQTPAGTKLIYDVLYVLDISQNLISVGQLLENKFALHFHDNMCDVVDESSVILFSVKMSDRNFPVEWKNTKILAGSSIVNNSSLWHKRFGHYNYTSLKEMHSKNMVIDMPVVNEDSGVCVVCQLGKQARLPFPNKASRAIEKMQLIHSDICGSMKVFSLNESKYFLIFIDDFSRMCWVYFIKQKSEVFGVFVRFKALVENESGNTIKAFRTDNGAKYTSNQLVEFLQKSGIHHQLTVTYTPQQNATLN